jgi:hypothetical protein
LAAKVVGATPVNISIADIPGPAFGVACVALALLFAVVRPRKIYAGCAATVFVKWGHSAVWALLATWFFARSAISSATDALWLLPLLAGFLYATYVATLIAVTRPSRRQH